MKRTDITPTFFIVCIAILIISYGIGFCIKEINLSRAEELQTKAINKQILINKELVASMNTRETSLPSRSIRDSSSANLRENNTNNRRFSRNMNIQVDRTMSNVPHEDIAAMQEQMQQFTNGGFGDMQGFDQDEFDDM